MIILLNNFSLIPNKPDDTCKCRELAKCKKNTKLEKY